MSTFSEFWRKQVARWHRVGIDRRDGLRRRLAYHVVRDGFEIGDFSTGAPDVLFFRDGSRLIVGKFSSFAIGVTFVLGGGHRTDFVSTYSFAYLTGEMGVSDQPLSRGDIVIGSDVWIAANATVLSGVTIGHGAVVGAGSVVIDDVPPYAVVFGNPARVVHKRFPAPVIEELLELRWWDLDEEQIRSLRPRLESKDVGAFIEACRQYRGLPPRQREPRNEPALHSKSAARQPAAPDASASGVAMRLVSIVRRELPEFTLADLDIPFERLGMDSYGMLILRAHVKEAFHADIDDPRWSDVITPADVVGIIGTHQPARAPAAQAGSSPRDGSQSPLWIPSPDRVAASQVMAFMAEVNACHGLALTTYRELHRWSIENVGLFWQLVWQFCGVVGEMGQRPVAHADKMPGAKFFPDARLNFAENLLRRSDDGEAIVFRGEDKIGTRLTWAELAALVSRMQQALQRAGVGVGDRVAAMLPNRPEAVALMLATTSIGAIWSSCSPDFGPAGVVNRFRQIEPKLFIVVDAYWQNGKAVQLLDRLQEIAPQLPTASTIVVSYLGEADSVAKALPRAVTLDAWLKPFDAKPLLFLRLPFDQPAFILYSSGTTGMPKCIVHGAGGTLLQHLKEHRLQCDVGRDDRMFYLTTCGWMMWNWLVSGLASGATILLYDGSPFSPSATAVWDYAQQERITLFGTSAKFIEACSVADLAPMRSHNLSSLRLITSTGSPLAPEGFDYVYGAIKRDVLLASISGGTDIVSCFVGADQTSAVWRGEIQAPELGMAVEVWSDEGQPMERGKGELVCTRPFVSMPVMFWNDAGDSNYRQAYFERFAGVWHQGDFAEWTSHGGMVIHGRSDATLNPGGIRFGTAEVYAAVGGVPEIADSICIGQDWNNDVRVVLFVRLKEGHALDDGLKDRIRQAIRANGGASHVPAKIIQIAEIPYTHSGKLTELAVRDVVHGQPVKNVEALANPAALDCYKDIAELRV